MTVHKEKAKNVQNRKGEGDSTWEKKRLGNSPGNL